MTVKALVDTIRTSPGYMGAVIFAGESIVFSEYLDLMYAMRLLSLAGGLSEEWVRDGRVSIITSMFTFHVADVGGLCMVLKLAGRFAPTPDFSLAEPEFEEPLQANRFPSRETIKAEAESLLKLYNLDRQD